MGLGREEVICLACGRPQLLDAFSGRGGAGVGYQRAGFCVSAVDNNPAHLMAYPIDCEGAQRFLGDAIEVILTHGGDFAVRHVSPTCTGYSRGTAAIPDRLDRYDRLIGATRAALQEVGGPYVIENVADARPELIDPAMLCGRMFGLTATDTDGVELTLDRHRLFETNWGYVAPEHVPHGWKTNQRDGVQVAGAYGGARRDKVEAREVRKGGYVPADLRVLQELLDIDWMDDEKAIFLAIPPAYTEHLGGQLISQLARQENVA
jgi:DNA (cytosine-5)-methyltransferase 1